MDRKDIKFVQLCNESHLRGTPSIWQVNYRETPIGQIGKYMNFYSSTGYNGSFHKSTYLGTWDGPAGFDSALAAIVEHATKTAVQT